MKLIALPITPDGGYHIVLKQPIGASGDLQGRKIRGTPVYASVVSMLGGVMTVLPPAEIYSALDKGIVDGASWPVTGALSFRWYEVAKYLMRPAFGVETAPILMNLNAWNRFSEEDKKIIEQEARKVEDAFFKEIVRMWADEEKALVAKGMMVTQIGDAQKAKLASSLVDGLWAMLAAEKNALLSKSCANSLAARRSRVDTVAAACQYRGGACRYRMSIAVCAAGWLSSQVADRGWAGPTHITLPPRGRSRSSPNTTKRAGAGYNRRSKPPAARHCT